MVIQRRSFVVRAAAAIASLAAASRANAQSEPVSPREPEESWLQGLSGRHRQFFDVNALNGGTGLRRVGNFLDAYRDAYHLGDRDLNAIFGAHGEGLAFTLNDSLWERFDLGVRYSVVDPRDGRPARRNIYATSDGIAGLPPSVAALQARGARFLACRQTIARMAHDLAPQRSLPVDDVRAAIEGGLLPGVTPVPAMVVAVNRAQEAGLTYVFTA
jgi:intracellular sulfur oxidation DsrE/DsrF family protein